MDKSKTNKKKMETKKPGKVLQFLIDFFDYYNKQLKKKHIIVYIICLIIFAVFLTMFISSIDVTTSISTLAYKAQEEIETTNIFSTIFKNTIPVVFLVIFAGITPFVYLPVIGFYYPYTLAYDIAESFMVTSKTGNLIFMTLGAIIQLVAISLAMVEGFNYCSISTKRFRYSQRSGFGMYNVKKHIYEIRQNKEALEKLEKDKAKKDEKIEKLNVKVPYMQFLKTFIVATVVAIIGTLISAI